MGLHMTGSTVTQLNNAFARLSGVQAVVSASGALVAGAHNPVDATSAGRTMTLADAPSAGLMTAVSKKDATANTVIVSVAHLRDGGAGSITLVGQYETLLLTSKADGSWWPVGDHKTKAYLDLTYQGLNPKALVANLPTPFAIAHRGGPNLAPEESMSAYRISVAQGVQAIEIDVQILADGTLVAMHDTTTTRTTTSTGNVADHTAASWSKLLLNTASITGEAGWPSETPPFVEQILRAYGNKVCIVPQPYDTASMIALDALVVAMGIDKRTILIQSFDSAGAAGTLTEARARGYETMKLYNAVPTLADLQALAALGTKHACLDGAVVTSQFCSDAVTAGVRPSTFAPADRTQRDVLLGMGIQGWFTDNPAWMMNVAPSRTTDAFKAGSFLAGHEVTQGNRGIFTSPNEWGFAAGAPAAARLGYISPPDPSNFTLTFDAKFSADGGSTASAFYVFAMQKDYASLDSRATQGSISLSGCNGYRFNADANSKLNTIRLTNNGAPTNVRLSDTASYLINTWHSYKLTVTPTTLKWEQVGISGPTVINDANYRTLRYLLFGNSIQAAVNFRNVLVV